MKLSKIEVEILRVVKWAEDNNISRKDLIEEIVGAGWSNAETGIIISSIVKFPVWGK